MSVISATSLNQELEWIAERILELPKETPREQAAAHQRLIATVSTLNRLGLIDIRHAHSLNDQVYAAIPCPHQLPQSPDAEPIPHPQH